jgi:hypothetical protein
VVTNLDTPFENVCVATFERAENRRFRLALLRMILSIPVQEDFVTTFYCALELDASYVVFD